MEEKRLVRPFDIVVTKKGGIGIVTETEGIDASVNWFVNPGHEKSAWWRLMEDNGIRIIGNAMREIADSMAHPFGGNTRQGKMFGFNDKQYNFAPNMSLSEYCRLCKHYRADEYGEQCGADVYAGAGSNGQNKCVFFESEEEL